MTFFNKFYLAGGSYKNKSIGTNVNTTIGDWSILSDAYYSENGKTLNDEKGKTTDESMENFSIGFKAKGSVGNIVPPYTPVIYYLEILPKVDDDAFIVLWDRQGKRISSLSFAKLIQDQADAGNNLNFIIGGAYGAASEVSQKSDLILSASDLTLPHRLFKIFLVEQIYRASAINTNHPYHK